MSGGDVALRFTWSTTHIEIYIFVFESRIRVYVILLLLLLLLSSYVFYSCFFFFFFEFLFVAFFCLYCCGWLGGILSLTITQNWTLFSHSHEKNIHTWLLSSFRLKSYAECVCVFDTVWQARPTWTGKKNMSTFRSFAMYVWFARCDSFFSPFFFPFTNSSKSFLLFLRLFFSSAAAAYFQVNDFDLVIDFCLRRICIESKTSFDILIRP